MQIWEVIASLANWNCSERDSGEFLSWWKSSIFCFLWKLPWAYKTENSFTWKFKICYSCCSVPKLCLTLCHPRTIACQAPMSMGFPRQAHWNWLPVPSLGDLPDPGIEPESPALAGRFFFFFTTEPSGKNIFKLYLSLKQWIKAKHSIH